MNMNLPPLNLKPVAEPRNEKRDIRDLRFHPDQEQLFPSEAGADIVKLADHIFEKGLKETIEILPNGIVLSGHRRLAALRRLAWGRHRTEYETVEVHVRYDLDAATEGEIRAELIEPNLLRRHVSALEELGLMVEATKARGNVPNKGKLISDLAHRRDLDVRTAVRYWNLLELPFELRRAVETRKLTQQLGQQILDHATPEQIQELTLIAPSAAKTALRKRVREMVQKPAPERQLKLPTPQETFELFLEAGNNVAVQFDSILRYVCENLHLRSPTARYNKKLRIVEAIADSLLAFLTQATSLEEDEIAYRHKLNKRSITECEAELKAKHEAEQIAQRQKLTTPPKTSPPRLVLKKDPPPLVLRKSPAA
jgi:hypothetical protein